MTKKPDVFAQLRAPFAPGEVEWRVGPTNAKKNGGKATRGQALCFIDARVVMNRLDAVVGPAGWQSKVDVSTDGLRVICHLGIKVDGEWIWKADGSGATDMEGEKGAISGALKRAAVLWGIGRYLYEIEAPWVQINEYKQIAPSEMARLQKILPTAQPVPEEPPPVTPQGIERAAALAFIGELEDSVKERGTLKELDDLWLEVKARAFEVEARFPELKDAILLPFHERKRALGGTPGKRAKTDQPAQSPI